MPKLTDTQLVMLSAAAQRADGVVELPENSKGAAAQKAAARLLREGLVEEVFAGRDLPAWRRDERDQPVALLITALGKEAIGIAEQGAVAGSPSVGEGGKPSAKTQRIRRAAPKMEHPPMIGTKTAKSSRTNGSDRTATRQCRSDAKKRGQLAARGKRGDAAQPATRKRRRKESKQQVCLNLLGRLDGASIEELQRVTGWQPHTVRGFLSGAVKRKLGMELISEKPADQPRRYRISQATA